MEIGDHQRPVSRPIERALGQRDEGLAREGKKGRRRHGAAMDRASPRSKTLGRDGAVRCRASSPRSEEHTSELQSLMRISYAVFCLKKTTQTTTAQKVRVVINNSPPAK